MGRGTKPGICCRCGQNTQLTFEHVPPQSAYNRQTLYSQNIVDMLQGTGNAVQQQGGVGDHTLCGPCNNLLGVNYVRAYAWWTNLALEAMFVQRSLINFKGLYPLRIIKEIIAMFASACGPHFMQDRPLLRDWVLKPSDRGPFQNLPQDHAARPLRVLVALMDPCSTHSIQTGQLAAFQLTAPQSSIGLVSPVEKTISVFSEIAFPPFIYFLTFNNVAPAEGFEDITYFSKFAYGDKVDMLQLWNKKPMLTANAADFRSQQELTYLQQPPIMAGGKYGTVSAKPLPK